MTDNNTQKDNAVNRAMEKIWNKLGFGMRGKLIIIFLLVKVIPLILIAVIAWYQIIALGDTLKEIAVKDASDALNSSAVENIERMTTDTADAVAEFLYERDDDIKYLSEIQPSEDMYEEFIKNKTGKIVEKGKWELSEDGTSWVRVEKQKSNAKDITSSNEENQDMDGFRYRKPDEYKVKEIPLYDEITYVDLSGNEQVKSVAANSSKINYPLSKDRKNISDKSNTYIKAENYFPKLKELKLEDIYVSDVIGAYTGSNYIGMYTPESLKVAEKERGYEIPFEPEKQSYAGQENPNGQRFEGIVRWAAPVTDDNDNITGYVTMALNHDHIMEFVDHLTPMNERYTQVPSAFEGNYAFIWDYNCRSICHPRHNSIVGYNPETGEPQIPWLETSIYEGWKKSGVEKWTDYVKDIPEFDNQSREKTPAAELTKNGLVGLDGRYLNNAPQCTGWMDLTQDGGSGSFYILWSGLYKLTTAASIPYYTGQYAPSEENEGSRRGFGIVTIGAGLEDFTAPATQMEKRLGTAINTNISDTSIKLIGTTTALIILVVLIAIWMASFLTGNITRLIRGISRFKKGERQFRFNAEVKDEFGMLADSFDDMAESIVVSVKDPITIIDNDYKVIYMNKPALKIVEKDLDQVVGTYYKDSSIYPQNSIYDPLIALENKTETEAYYVEDKDWYIKGTANYVYDKDGNQQGYQITTANLTTMIKEQRKIEEQKILLDRIFSSSPDMVWFEDEFGKYITVNPRFASIVGEDPENFEGKTAHEIFPEQIAESFIASDKDTISSGKPHYIEELIKFDDGHEETLESVRTPIYDSEGVLIGILGFARNVTTRVNIEKELRKTKEDLEAAVKNANLANEHKSEFLARMSHEIRTPMNAIIGITSILQKKLSHIIENIEESEVGSHINQIETSSQHLLGLLNDILEVSKIEAGKIDIVKEKVNIVQILDTVSSIIKPRCSEKGIDFVVIFDEFPVMVFMTDPLRLRQILINLLGNAVKFTPENGEIVFQVTLKERKDDKSLIRFSIKDNGIGISDEEKKQIFQPFERSIKEASRKQVGTGLGLSISKNIAQLMGSDIELTSEVDKGSEFSFELWLEETENDIQQIVDTSILNDKFDGKKILLVDDVEINRLIIESMLSDTNIEIVEAENGKEAVDIFTASDDNEFNMILMDVQMPVMDGYEASEEIRKSKRKDATTVPIIAITANAFKEDIDNALEAGMNSHLAKPVDMENLFVMLNKYL